MKKLTWPQVIILSVTLFASITLLPLLWTCDIGDALSLGSSFAGGLAGVGAIVFGYKVFQDVAKPLRFNRQFDAVDSLANEIYTLQVQLTHYKNGELHSMAFSSVNDALLLDEDWKKNSQAIFEISPFFEVFGRIEKLRTDRWFPEDLKNELSFPFGGKALTVANLSDAKYQSYTLVKFLNTGPSQEVRWGVLVDQEVTIKQVLDWFLNARKRLDNWLKV